MVQQMFIISRQKLDLVFIGIKNMNMLNMLHF